MDLLDYVILTTTLRLNEGIQAKIALIILCAMKTSHICPHTPNPPFL